MFHDLLSLAASGGGYNQKPFLQNRRELFFLVVRAKISLEKTEQKHGKGVVSVVVVAEEKKPMTIRDDRWIGKWYFYQSKRQQLLEVFDGPDYRNIFSLKIYVTKEDRLIVKL